MLVTIVEEKATSLGSAAIQNLVECSEFLFTDYHYSV